MHLPPRQEYTGRLIFYKHATSRLGKFVYSAAPESSDSPERASLKSASLASFAALERHSTLLSRFIISNAPRRLLRVTRGKTRNAENYGGPGERG